MYGMFRLKRFLQKIGPRIRAVVLPYLEGRSIREIAAARGMKPKAVHGRLHLAREHPKTLAFAFAFAPPPPPPLPSGETPHSGTQYFPLLPPGVVGSCRLLAEPP